MKQNKQTKTAIPCSWNLGSKIHWILGKVCVVCACVKIIQKQNSSLNRTYFTFTVRESEWKRELDFGIVMQMSKIHLFMVCILFYCSLFFILFSYKTSWFSLPSLLSSQLSYPEVSLPEMHWYSISLYKRAAPLLPGIFYFNQNQPYKMQ